MSKLFFTDERLNFFRPLVSKYREQVVHCLALLYQRLYGSAADYGQSLTREQVIEIFEEALARCPSVVLESIQEDQEQRFKNHREQANWVLKQLLDGGWIENQVDPASFQSTFPFSRLGRIFSQSLIDSDSTHIRTRHRNTRNTLNSLEAFASRGEIYDLLDAFEYSERIITDFTDVIAELEERKRDLVREVEAQQLVQQATDHFFDFMEKRFQPDIQVRMSADSVEKHRDDINKIINRIRKKRKESKAQIELELRRIVPELCSRERSFLLYILDTIEQRMRNAAEIMLPALRKALHGFTKRADIIIRQLSYLNTQQNNNLLAVCKELCEITDEDFDQRSTEAAEQMAVFSLRFVDPQQIKIIERKQKPLVDTSVPDIHQVDESAQRDLYIQQLLDQAFTINNGEIREYLHAALRDGQRISTRDLPIENASHLLKMAHIIEVGAATQDQSVVNFKVEATGKVITTNEFFKAYDEFTIELASPDSE